MTIHRLVATSLATGALCATTAAGAGAAQVKINHWAEGAVASFSSCAPQAGGDELCDDRVVFFGRSGTTRDGDTAHRAPAELSLEHFSARIHPDGSAEESAEFGAAQVPGSYDASRLTFARTPATTLALYDVDPDTGALSPTPRTAALGPFEWTAASDVHVFGNDGPFGFGLPRRQVERCSTQLENAHERFTTARVTGTIDGTPVSRYGQGYLPWPGTGPADARGAIFSNRFTVISEEHGGASC